jgi:hypothetical protein
VARSRSDFLTAHAPICGVLIRAGTSKSPRVIGRLWHEDAGSAPAGAVVLSSSVLDQGDVSGWEREIDLVVSDANEDGPCVRLELLDPAGRPSVTWQASRKTVASISPSSEMDSNAQALAVMAAGYADLVQRCGEFVAVQTRAHEALGQTFAASLDRLMSLCADVVEAHSQAAETTLESAMMVVEGTGDTGPATDQTAMWGLLSKIAGNMGIPVPDLSDFEPPPAPTSSTRPDDG